MRSFGKFLKVEFKRLLIISYMISGVLFFALSLYYVHNGAQNFHDEQQSKEVFAKLENDRLNGNYNYDQIGVLGIWIKFIPSTGNIFTYNSGSFPGIDAHVNVMENLNISDSFLGKKLFKEKPGFYSDFSGFMLLLGSLLLLVYGYDTVRPDEYLKTLTTLAGRKKVFFYSISARFLLITLFFAFVTIVGTGWGIVEGVHLSGNAGLYYLYFFLSWVIAAYVFFIVGSIIGRIKSERLGNTVLFMVWILFIHILPTMVNKIMMESSAHIQDNYQVDQKKLTEWRNFERRAIAKDGIVKDENRKSKSELEWIESFWNNEYQNIRRIDRDLEKQVAEKIQLHHTISALFPSTFISSVRNELSSKGYENTLDFFRYAQEVRHEFCKYYKEKRFYSDDKKVECFIKNEENLFYAKSRLPSTFLAGMLLMLVYSVTLTIISYRLFNNSLDSIPAKDLKKFGNMDLSLKNMGYKVLRTFDNLFPSLLFSLFSGRYTAMEKKGFKGKMKLNGADIGMFSKALDFVYICTDRFFPKEIKIIDFLSMCAAMIKLPADRFSELIDSPSIQSIKTKRFKQLDPREWNAVSMVLALMKKSGIYLFFDIAAGMDSGFARGFINMMFELSRNGAAVVYVTTDGADYDEPFERNNYYIEDQYWVGGILSAKKKNKKELSLQTKKNK